MGEVWEQQGGLVLEKSTETISLFAFEQLGVRLERANRRLFLLCIILAVALFVSNGLWIFYNSQFTDEISIEQDIDSGEGDTIVSGIGDIAYGKDKTKDN